MLCREAIVWKRLDHPNIVPFKGVTLNPLQLVSDWMPGGELREYVKKNPNANPISLVRQLPSVSTQRLTLLLS
jgi:serine/threonine protein kinase